MEVNSSTNLVPYLKVKDDFTIENAAYVGGNRAYLKMIKINGFDIRNLREEEQDAAIDEINDGFQLAASSMSLVKIDDSLDLKANKQFLINCREKISKDPDMNVNQRGARVKALNEMISQFDDDGDLSENQLKKEFYLAIYNQKFRDIESDTNTMLKHLRNARLGAEECTSLEIVNVIKHLLDPTLTKFTQKELDDHKDHLDELLSFESIDFYAKWTKTFVSDEDGIKVPVYTNYSTIKEYPVYPLRAWMFGLMDLPNTNVVMNIGKTNEKQFETELNKTIQTMKTNISSTKQKEQTKLASQEAELDVMEDVVDDFSKGKEKFRHINVILISRELSEKALASQLRQNAKACKENEMEMDNLTFHQLEGYESALLKEIDPLFKDFGRDTNTTAVAEAFPFISTNVIDPMGVYFARNNLGEPLVVDFFKNLRKDSQGNTDPTRLNANMTIMAKTGSGKSSAMKTMLLQQAAIGNKIVIIDPSREYNYLVEYLHGTIINAANGKEGRINPLQPMPELSNDEMAKSIKENNEDIIKEHVIFLSEWFSILYPTTDDFTNIAFSKMLSSMYESWFKKHPKLAKKPIENWKAEEFPIFDDLIKYIESLPKEKHDWQQGRDLTSEVLFFIKSQFSGFGQYSNLYNGYSTVKITGDKAVLFDISQLLNKNTNNSKIVQSQLLLIVSYIKSEIRNSFSTTNDNMIICIDEAHLLIDEKNPVALDFVFQTSKMIRKRRGAIWLATQNPEDFMGTPEIAKKTKAITNNSQYAWYGHMTSDNISQISEMYSGEGGLTSSQVDYLISAGKGQAVFMTGGMERQNIQMKHMSLTMVKGFA